MKYAIVTFGCRVNQADSLAIEGELRARGGEAAAPVDADLVVVNSCSVTATADQGVRQTVRRIVRGNPAVRVVVTGCYATRRPDEISELPNVVQVVPNPNKARLVADLTAIPAIETADRDGGEGPCGAPLTPGVGGRTAFTLRVQTGCDQVCSYCIIPTTRGAGRSRPLDLVVRDLEQAIAAGYKEIAITGVHLGSYGRDLPAPTSLGALVRRLAAWPEDVLFRLSSLEPMDCTDEIVDLAASPRIAPHVHLPLQHGSDEMLRAMRRPYTVADYERLIARLHARLPDAAIGTDLIVGFPGETDSHAGETRRVVEGLPLSHLHVFPYSDRPGTEASALTPKVAGAVIRERGAAVRAVADRLARRFRGSQRGRERRALVVDDGRSAVTDNYIKVRLDEARPRNTWVRVRVP